MAVLSGMKPEQVFSYFEKLCAVPHGSGNTKQVSDLCAGFARELKLKYRQDSSNNLILWKNGSAGYENAEPVILQGHLDMVCAKTEDCTKDMAKEGLDLETDGSYVWAKNTSLGADNGIAVAMILAVLADDSLAHPPIEAVFTTDEEIGMCGAFDLDCSDLKGKKLINIDSEEEGIFTVSCAGGVRTDCFLPGQKQPFQNGEAAYIIELGGLQGGHSGADIDKGRGSANQLMGRVLYSLMEQVPELRLADIQGGVFDNVIASHNKAAVVIPQQKTAKLESFIHEFNAILKNEYAGCDDNILLSCHPTELSPALDAKTTSAALHLLLALPQGVQAMNVDFPGLVQTSLNLGIIRLEEDGLHFTFSIRSCIASQKAMMVQRVKSLVEYAGGSVQERNSYPGWQYAKNSPLKDTVLAAYRDICGKEGIISATHGGLECGLFIEKIPGLDAISLGPEMHDVHSVRERLSIPSTARVYELLCEILKRSR